VQPAIIQDELPTVIALLAGLVTFKAVIITCLGPLFQLTKTESIRTGMLLSGGGEFAFVVLTLADKLHVLPDKLAKILVGVVVISMALTPYLSNVGDELASMIEEYEQKDNIIEASRLFGELLVYILSIFSYNSHYFCTSLCSL
jgi:Kef-type K+ transport system membrane component KefB